MRCAYGRCWTTVSQSVVLPGGESMRYCKQHAYYVVGQRAAKAWKSVAEFSLEGLRSDRSSEKQWCLEQIARLAEVPVDGLGFTPGTAPSGAPRGVTSTRIRVGRAASVSSHPCAVVIGKDLFDRRYYGDSWEPLYRLLPGAPAPRPETYVICGGDYNARCHTIEYLWEKVHKISWVAKRFDRFDLGDNDGQFTHRGIALLSFDARCQKKPGSLLVVDERVLLMFKRDLETVGLDEDLGLAEVDEDDIFLAFRPPQAVGF